MMRFVGTRTVKRISLPSSTAAELDSCTFSARFCMWVRAASHMVTDDKYA